MTQADVPGARPTLVARGRVLVALALAVALSGCSGQEYGTVPASPRSETEVVQGGAPKKGAPAPRVPRGPGQAKALQEANAK